MICCFRPLAILAVIGCLCFIGCSEPAQTSKNSGSDLDAHDHDHDSHDHDHDADHDDEGEAKGKLGPLGPNGGHQIDFSGEPMNAEWIHYNDNDVIRVVVLDQAGKVNRKIKAESIKIRRSKGNAEGFTLMAESPDADGTAESFMLDDKALAIAMVLGVNVEIEVDGKNYVGKIPPHEPHSH